MSKDNKKDIQYQIVKSEACGHIVQYKMIKKEGRCWDGYEPTPGKEPYSKGSCQPVKKDEHGLEKARIDEGKSPREKMKAREERSPKERAPRELNPDQYETAKKIARTKAIGEKERKQTLKDALHTHKMKQKDKLPSKEDLEYPMAASEKECNCKDCDCDKKEMNKREKFYIHKIQELRKRAGESTFINNADAWKRIQEKREANAVKNRLSQDTPPSSPIDRFSVSAGNNNRPISGREMVDRMAKIPQNKDPNQPLVYPNPSKTGAPTYLAGETLADAYNQKFRSGSKSDSGEYVMRDAPQGTERATQGMLNNLTGLMPKQTAPAAAQTEVAPASTTPAATQTETASKTTQASNTGFPEFDATFNEQAKKQGFNPTGETPSQPAKTTYDIKNPYKVESAKNFGDAFNQARSKIGSGGVFEYGGKKYHTYTQDEFKNPEKSGVPTDSKFYKDWQAKKDVTGPGAYYANKMNPAPAAKQTMAPAESIKDSPATPNTENAPSANPMKGEDLGSTKLRLDQNMMPKNQA
jgi:hypothetical protein